MDRKTRKLFIIYGSLHPKSDVERLYILRKEGGKQLVLQLSSGIIRLNLFLTSKHQF